MGETAKIAEPLSGEKLYQKRARKALPILVREAQAQNTIYYSDLALELGMPNPRNLNYVLGSIGQALESLSDEWDEDIPPIQCVVINKHTGLPGEGIGWFITHKVDFRKLPLEAQQELVWAQLRKVFEYPKWPAVLKAFGLSSDYAKVLHEAAASGGRGESKQHQALKEYVRKHPEVLQLPDSAGEGATEFHLPSGDILDVLFRVGDDWQAAEVKSAISDVPDLVRGMFQCVKYRAVIKAYQATQYLPQSVRVVLVLEGKLPAHLINMKHLLDIEIIEDVKTTVSHEGGTAEL